MEINNTFVLLLLVFGAGFAGAFCFSVIERLLRASVRFLTTEICPHCDRILKVHYGGIAKPDPTLYVPEEYCSSCGQVLKSELGEETSDDCT